jgi:hypothetical protein
MRLASCDGDNDWTPVSCGVLGSEDGAGFLFSSLEAQFSKDISLVVLVMSKMVIQLLARMSC